MSKIVTVDKSGFSISRAKREATEAIRSTVRAFAWEIKRHIMADMRAPKHGRAYSRPGGRIHIASSPGESPAVDTGNLIDSLEVREFTQANGGSATVGTNVRYARYLEDGTSFMDARPFAKPAADAHRQPFVDALRDHVTRALNGEGGRGSLPVVPHL